jgi:hypothetical protein
VRRWAVAAVSGLSGIGRLNGTGAPMGMRGVDGRSHNAALSGRRSPAILRAAFGFAAEQANGGAEPGNTVLDAGQATKSETELSVRLKFTGPLPVFVGPPFRTTFLLPKNVSTLAKMLVMSAVPIFLLSPMRTAVLLPKKVGAFANGLIQALLRFGQNVSIIPIWSQGSAPTDMHAGGQALEIGIGHQLGVGRCLRCFRFVFSVCRRDIWAFDRDRIGM